MSDKQLTVAELLARAGRDTGASESPRRRRRRSLDEGGISVAELTGSIPAVQEKPVESKHSSVPIDAPTEESEPGPDQVAAPTPGSDSTVVFERVEEVEEVEEPVKAGEFAAMKTADTAVAEPTVPAVDSGQDEELDPFEEPETTEVEEKTSVTGVILMAIIGIVLGVVVFKGFELLWDSFSRPAVAVLAVLVTVGMVGVVKALRTANDGLSMFLAALVGLVMTFGPLAVVLI